MTSPSAAKPMRMVVKIGTATLASGAGEPDASRIRRFVKEIATLKEQGVRVTIVSSGAIAAGLAPLGLRRRPSDMPTLQAAAAVGQRRLMDLWAAAARRHGLVVAQVLLTEYDVVHRQGYVNAKNTLARLLDLGVVPIVNENDTVAVEEIRFGDNDRLAALVANIVQADVLVMLSDVDGLFTGDPRRLNSVLIRQVDEISPELIGKAGRRGSALASGGMASKLEAARVATLSGVGVVIARGDKLGVLASVASGEQVGTYFPPKRLRGQARKLWIAWASRSRGRIVVDAGARNALLQGGKSLLAVGIKEVDGTFRSGDAVDVCDESGVSFARGLVSYDSKELIGSGVRSGDREVIHRDQLVLL